MPLKAAKRAQQPSADEGVIVAVTIVLFASSIEG